MKLPDRWLEYTSYGKQIPGTRFVCFKTPLDPVYFDRLHNAMDISWTPMDMTQSLPDVGLVIDLTFSRKYYNPEDLSAQHVKIFCKGHEIPNKKVIKQFNSAVEQFFRENSDNGLLVGVHCTHGLNRTGYLVCRHMIDVLRVESTDAIARFEAARGHPMERPNYLSALSSRGHQQDCTEGHQQNFSQGDQQDSSQGRQKNFPRGRQQNFSQGHQHNFSQGDQQDFSRGHQQALPQGHQQDSSQGRQRDYSQGRRQYYSQDRKQDSSQGRQQDYSLGRRQDYSQDRKQDYSRGRQQDYSQGRQQNYSQGRQQDYSQGRQQDYSQGRQQDYSQGHQQDFSQSREQDYSQGRQQDYSQGRQQNFSQGHSMAARREHSREDKDQATNYNWRDQAARDARPSRYRAEAAPAHPYSQRGKAGYSNGNDDRLQVQAHRGRPRGRGTYPSRTFRKQGEQSRGHQD